MYKVSPALFVVAVVIVLVTMACGLMFSVLVAPSFEAQFFSGPTPTGAPEESCANDAFYCIEHLFLPMVSK